MANENANQDIKFDDFDLECEQISNQLEEQLKEHVEGLEFLKEEIEQIGNPDNLGNVIQEVVWEQFINQIGVIAGEDFIKENRNLHLDLRDKAHIQIVENFVKGDLATHNHESIKKIEESYDRYKNVSHKEFRQDHENKG
ncbi:MAG: cation diffusion facilitator family transporter, partial [Leptotrichiaceae bacterium]